MECTLHDLRSPHRQDSQLSSTGPAGALVSHARSDFAAVVVLVTMNSVAHLHPPFERAVVRMLPKFPRRSTRTEYPQASAPGLKIDPFGSGGAGSHCVGQSTMSVEICAS